MQEQPRRSHTPARRLILAAVALLAIAGAPVSLIPAGAATTERVVVDRRGLAISGFDPVAYFTDKAARQGKSEFEYTYGGAVWRFRNPGNRAAFIADPDVYMPRFGGYDAVDVARGIAVAGDPRLWIVVGRRLYLFYTEQTRQIFARKQAQTAALAEKNWPAVRTALSP